MTPELRRESEAHEQLRDAIRSTTLAMWDRRIAEGRDRDEDLSETRGEVETGVLVDYVVARTARSGAGGSVTESRIIAWLSVAIGAVAVYPQARDLWREWQARRSALTEQAALVAVLNLPVQRLPADALRDIYDSTRRP